MTWGSEVRSHDEISSSAEERDANELEVVEGAGGNIRSLIWLERHRGVGMERRYGALGGVHIYGTHMSIAAMNCKTFLSAMELRRLLIDEFREA